MPNKRHFSVLLHNIQKARAKSPPILLRKEIIMRQNDYFDSCNNFVDVFNGNIAGSVNRRPCRDNQRPCGQENNSSQNRPMFPSFPNIQSQCPVCPPGTRPCRPMPMYCPYPPNCQNCDHDDNIEAAFFNTTGATVSSGGLVPFAFVTGTGLMGRNVPTNGTIMLDSGLYLITYSINGVSPVAGQTITAVPEYQGTSHTEYSRSDTVDTVDGYFNLNNTFLAFITSDTTLDIKLNITPAEATTTPVPVTDVSASLTLVKLRDFRRCNHGQNSCNCRD